MKFHCNSFPIFAGSFDSDGLLYSMHARTYSDCFVRALVMEAEKDKDIVIVHAGMEMDPSFQLFRERFPDRFFDLGMAEQHAVTFSAGLSCGGLKPFCIIPSTFLQRAYDQVYLSLFVYEILSVRVCHEYCRIRSCRFLF